MESNADIPPEIENQFLKNMMAFEDAHTTNLYRFFVKCNTGNLIYQCCPF